MKKLILSILVAALAGGWFLTAAAAEGFIVNWESGAWAPSFYKGKILPTAESGLRVNFEMTVNDVLVDLTGKKIQWFVDYRLAAEERGKQSIEIPLSGVAGQKVVIKIIVKNFYGRDLEKTVVIPITRPEAVIERVEPQSFRAWPFFFSVPSGDLDFSWKVNGQKSEGQAKEPFLLELVTGNDLTIPLNIRATVQNRLNLLEIAKKMLIVKL